MRQRKLRLALLSGVGVAVCVSVSLWVRHATFARHVVVCLCIFVAAVVVVAIVG